MCFAVCQLFFLSRNRDEELFLLWRWSLFFFFLICIKISANLFFFFPPGDFVLLLHLSFKSLSCKSKCKHFYIYKHFVALIKTRLFQLYATTCHSTWKAKLISALYLVMSQSLLWAYAWCERSVKIQSTLV